MNNLQLCQHTRQECGVQGQGPSTVIGQQGLLKKIVEWVRDGDLFVQSIHADWDYLWSEFTADTVESDDEITKPSDLGMWDRESFAVDRGTADGRSLGVDDFKKWRRNNNIKTNQPPYRLTILPNNNLRLSQPADDIYEIYASYWKAPVIMSANTDEPLYPERFQRIIIAKAKMWFFAYQESFTQYQDAEKEYNEWLEKLEYFAAPGQFRRAQSENVLMQVVPM